MGPTGVVLVLLAHNKQRPRWDKLARCLVVPIRVWLGYSRSMLKWLDSLVLRHKMR
jgi:hypothetical protein